MSRWAACGAMALTGPAGGPPLEPAHDIAETLDAALRPFGLDAAVLGWRAAAAGFGRQGQVSCGGATRLLPASDGWLALALARRADLDCVPALLGIDFDGWDGVAAAVRSRPVEDVVGTAALLGVPCTRVGGAENNWAVRGSARPGAVRAGAPVVVDLSALWAGPLCAQLLRRRGARVLKLERPDRPDGARQGPADFFDALHEGVRDAVLGPDMAAAVAGADIVITSARARAIEQLGLDPLAGATDRVWVAITAHGWASNRVGFGDDAAVAGGLVADWEDRPCFVADAVADPLTGTLAAAAAWDCYLAGGTWFVDASMAGAAASVARDGPSRSAVRDGELWVAPDGEAVAAPRLPGRTGRMANDREDTRSFVQRIP